MERRMAPPFRPITWRRGVLLLALFLIMRGTPGQAQLPEVIPEVNHGLSLDECIQLGLQLQPAMAAAGASLEAAQASAQGLHNLRFAGRFVKEMPQRRQQSCWGIVIAQAALQQAEWETRYAVTRLYFSVIYARSQKSVLESVVARLQANRDFAKKVVDLADVKSKIKQKDVDTLDVQLAFYQARQVEAEVGIERALAALREAIGIGPEFALEVPAEVSLPAVVNQLDLQEMVALGLANRGEMTQASSAYQVTGLEIQAQQKHRGIQAQTFAAGGDIHAKPIPQGVSNNEYRPWAIGLEMPPYFAGRKHDRVNRAWALYDRAGAVVEKTSNLVTLEIEAFYFKWQESARKVAFYVKAKQLAAKIGKQTNFDFGQQKATGEELIRATTLEDQAQAQYNEALFNHAIALAALERVTGGGYRPPYEAKQD